MAHATADPAASPHTRPPSGLLGIVGLGIAVAVLIAGGLTFLTGAQRLASLALPDPGTLTTVALPVMRAASEIFMVLTIGAVLLAAFLVPPQRTGYLDVAGYRALRVASWSAAGWLAAAALLVPLNVADILGRPVGEVLDPAVLFALVPRLSGATAWSVTALIALVVLAGCRSVLTWGWTAVLFGITLLGPLPVTLTGHSAAGGAHDVATDSLVVHVVAASLWGGGAGP